MKTFKHLKTWRVAEESPQAIYHYHITWWNVETPEAIRKELIENSYDREEVIEKDWIDKLFIEYEPMDERTLRELINQYMPRISEEEIDKLMIGSCNSGLINKIDIIDLLRSKGLLAD